MAPPATGTKFASVNLNKSYGQPASIVPGAPAYGIQSSGRSHMPTQGGMLLLTRPVRSQPSGVKGVKLTVPRPMNLPSLRREHSGNDPTIALVGVSGASGWSKQQQQPADNVGGQSVSAIHSTSIDSPSAAVRSVALSTESTWGTPPNSNHNVELRSLSFTTPVGRPTVYTPPGARTVQVDGASTQRQPPPALKTKAVVLRGEDFPTLQASIPPPSASPQQRQKELQQRQREKLQELKEQQEKLHELSRQRTENPASLQQLNPQLQLAQSMRPQTKPKQNTSSTLCDKQSVCQQDNPAMQSSGKYRKASGSFPAPPPLVRLSHTSNWTDDERETSHCLRPQSDWPERDRVCNESCSLDLWTLDRSDDLGYGRSSVSRNGLPLGHGRDAEANQDPYVGKDSGFASDGWNGRDNGLSNYAYKEAYSGRAGLNSREGRDNSFGWEGNYKRGWGSGKDSISKIDARFGPPTGFSRDGMQTRNNGYTKDIYLRSGNLGSGTDREAIYGRESPVRDAHRGGPVREGNFRDGYFRDGVFANDNMRLGMGGDQDKSRRWQGDRFVKTFSYQQEGLGNSGRTNSFVRGRIQDFTSYDSGKDKRQSYTEDSFMREVTDMPFLGIRTNSGLGMEHVGLDLKVPRRKKDVTKEDNFWDPERESFEAELERVQKMLEQERQRMVEQRERAVELARKEQEERERAAREEEERQHKLEQEAKEAALREEREIVEAAQRFEEERSAREEEKRRIVIEEERRKEAARRKLNELEERIAKRETERKRDETHALGRDERVYMGRPRDDDEVILRGGRERDDVDWEEQEHFTSIASGPDHDDDERTPFRPSHLPYSSAREVSNERNLQVKHLERGSRSLDLKTGTGVLSERFKAVPAWRRESVYNGNGPTLVPLRDGFLSNRQPDRGFSPRDSLYGSQRNIPPALSQDKGTSDLLVRKDRAPYLQQQQQQQQQWNSNEDLDFSARYSLPAMDSAYYDSYDRDVDRNWMRDNQRWVQESHRLSSPLPSSYLQDADVTDQLPFGRSRQSLPRQPRVLPPPSRVAVQKPAMKTDNRLSLTSSVSDNPKIQQSGSKSHEGEGYVLDAAGHFKLRSERADVEEKVENVYYRGNFLHDMQPSEQEETVLQLESVGQPDFPSQSSEMDSQESLTLGSQSPPEMQAESTTSDLLREANEEDANACSATANEKVFDSEIIQDSPSASKEASVDDEDMEEEWAMEGGDEGLREADADEDFDHGYDGAANQNLESRECDSSKNGEDAASRSLAMDYKEVTMEEQNCQKTHKDVVVDSELLEGMQVSQVVDIVEEEQEIVEAESHSDKSVNEAQSLQEVVVEPFLQRGPLLTSNAIDSMQLREQHVLNSRQSLVQQFQQPFSFMAMPLPQSNASSNSAQHPLGLAPMPGLQNQSEIPFQVQLGLLPGTPLLPNAIQIGSIQMPLHLHPQIPRLTHLHASEAPVFQFGQIGHSAPLSQPLTMVQPAMQIHHPLCQTTPLQSYQAQTAQQIEDSCQDMSTITVQQNAQPSDQGEVLLSQKFSPGLMELKSTLEGRNHVEEVSRGVVNPNMQPQPVSDLGVKQRAGPPGPQTNNASRKVFQEASTDIDVETSASTGMVVDQVQGNDGSIPQSSGMPYGGRRKGGDIRSVFFGRGRGRFYSRKIYEAPRFASETSMWSGGGEGYARNRGRRNFRRAEFRVKDSGSSVDRNLTHSVSVGKRQLAQEMGSEVFSGFSNSERVDGKMYPFTQIHRASCSDAGQNAGTVVGSRPSQLVRRGNQLSTAMAPEKNSMTGVSSGSRTSEGIIKKYVNSEAPADTSLQSGVVYGVEQPGSETPKDEDDFIEVRSKRQMLNDRREQREKQNKTKSKDLKGKEHVVRKQQRLPVKDSQHTEFGMLASSKSAGSQMVERQAPLSKFGVEAAGNEIRQAQHGCLSGVSSTLSQSSVNAPAQLLAPIGTPASCSLDTDKMAKNLGPMHASSSMGISSIIEDSSSNTNMPWGGQRSSQHVVSFTQIQLEEAMKPAFFGGPSSQQQSLPERGSRVLELGIPVSIAHEKTSTAVSGPISSLLAGEKIQFGAVTSPTFISPSNRPLSPAIIGSSLGSRADDISDLTSQARHLFGLDTSDGDVGFRSRNKRAKGDDISRHVVDAEAEAEAAASAVAAAGISSDESVGSMHRSNARNVSLVGMTMPISGDSFENADSTAGSKGIPTMRPVAMQTPIIEDSMAMALPADLSVENPPLLFRGPGSQGSSGFLLPPPPCGPSPFPCLEMGTMLGGSIFALGPQEDAPLISQGSNKPVCSLEAGLPAIGPGGVGGWQQRHSGGVMDSFYGGPPSGFTGPFISPTGTIPSMQGPPHMLVYTNPFASVGQYGQFGVSFMGTAYLPSRKQPDWKHTPVPISSSAGSGVNGGEIGSNLGGIMAPQLSTGMPNTGHRTAPGVPSVMPAVPPLNVFDHNLSAPFQISNADVPLHSQWSHVTSQHPHNGSVSGPIVGLTLQPHHSGGLRSQIGSLPHMMDTSGSHPVSLLKLASTVPFHSVDAVGQFHDEFGLVDSVSLNTSSVTSGGQKPSSRGHVSNLVTPATPGPSGDKLLRGRRSSRAFCGSNHASGGLTTAGAETGLGSLDGQSANGNPCSPHFQTLDFGQSGAVGQHAHLVGYTDQRGASQQGAGRVNIGNVWPAGHRKGEATGRTLVSGRGPLGERAFPSKLKQVYVAKPSSSQKSATNDYLTPDSGASIFSSQEVSRATIGC